MAHLRDSYENMMMFFPKEAEWLNIVLTATSPHGLPVEALLKGMSQGIMLEGYGFVERLYPNYCQYIRDSIVASNRRLMEMYPYMVREREGQLWCTFDPRFKSWFLQWSPTLSPDYIFT